MHWYVDVLKKYATFSGRARRKEYWMFVLYSTIISIVLTFIDNALGASILSALYSLAVLVPSLAVSVRRLHDTGRSGWWLLIALIPVIGALVLLIFCVLNSEDGDNAHGPNPKQAPVQI